MWPPRHHLLQTAACRSAALVFLLCTIGVHSFKISSEAYAENSASPAEWTSRQQTGLKDNFLQFVEAPVQPRRPLSQPAASDDEDDREAPEALASAVDTQGLPPQQAVLMQMAAEGQRNAEFESPAGEAPVAAPGSPTPVLYNAQGGSYVTSMLSAPPSVQSGAEAIVPAASRRFPLIMGRHYQPTFAQMDRAGEGGEYNDVASNVGQRPGAGSGTPDVVSFAVYGKTFYGVDLKEQEFTVDSILTLQWMDARDAALVPVGQDEATLSADEASRMIWLPKVAISNRIARRFDRISSSVTVAKDGKVTQVERSLAVIKNKMVLDHYPFDQQVLRLNVASTQYMLDEVVLEPMKQFAGLRKGFFDGEDYEEDKFKLHVYKDVDGSLKKSRGSMEVTVKRNASRFHRTFLLPAIIYLAAACAVFWLPFSPTFVTARLALSILILLVFSNLATKADSELPPAAPYNWIDLMCFTIQLHMFAVVCLNIFTEVAYHSMKCTRTAVHISNELKIIAPLMATFPMVAILVASRYPDGALDLHTMTALMPVCFAFFILTYLSCCGSTLSAEMARNRRAEEMKSQDFVAGGGLGSLSSAGSLQGSTSPKPDQY